MSGVTVFGAGAIGGLLAARLAASGVEVSIVARGAHLAAIRERGLVLETADERMLTRPRIVEHVEDAGPAEFLVLAVKANALVPALPALRPLVGPETVIVAALNGIPWWYGYGQEGKFRDRRVLAVDPQGALWAALPPAQALGCIVYPAASIAEPGVIRHLYGDRFSLGEPDGSRSARAERFAAMLIGAGFKAPVRPRIRDEIWVKLWGNLAFNPLSALTCATLDRILADAGTRAVARAMMVEAARVAEGLGVRFAIDVEKRMKGAEEVGAHKTSMLQDLEQGRPLEIEALLGAVVEMAGWVGAAVPLCEAVLALTRLRAEMR